MIDHREPLLSQDARDTIAVTTSFVASITLTLGVSWALLNVSTMQHADHVFRAQRNYIDCVKALQPGVPIQSCGTFPTLETNDD